VKGDAATGENCRFHPVVCPSKFQIRVFVQGDGKRIGNTCQTGEWIAHLI
jgi:hypothetical protein